MWAWYINCTFFVPKPWQSCQAGHLQKRSKRWLLRAKTFYNRWGRVVLPTIHSLIIGTTSFAFHICVWKHPVARWTVCSNCSKCTCFHGNVKISRNFDCKCVIGGLILNSLLKVSSPSANILLSSLKCKYFFMCSKRTLVIKVLTYWMPKFFDQYSRERGTGHMDIFNKTA